MYIALIHNTALLIALTTLYSLASRLRQSHATWFRICAGLLFGAIAVAGMMMPVEYTPGIIYDGRSIVLSLAGLFGGPVAAGIAVTTAGAYRAILGGAGMWAGLATIVGCALVGLVFRRLCKERPDKLSIIKLYLVGFATHAVMLACQLAFLPRTVAVGTVGDVWLPVMLIFPVATVFAGLLLQVEDRRWHIESKLLRSQDLLLQSQSIGKVGSWELDLARNSLRWSEEVYRIFGVDPEKFAGTYEAFLDCVHPADRETVNEAYTSSVDRRRDSYEIEHRIILPDTGVTRFVQEKCKHLKDTKDRVVRSVGFVQDITERKQFESELEHAKQFAEHLVQAANVIFVQLDLDGKVVNFNKAAEETTGYRLEELKGKSWFDTLVPKERFPHVWEMFSRIKESGALPQSFENPIVTKSGEERQIVWQNSLLFDGERTVGTISFGIDVTERKRAEEALKESERRLSLAFQMARAGHWEYDVASDTFLFNDNFYRIFRTTAEQVGGYRMSSAEYAHRFVHPDDAQIVTGEVQRAIETTDPDYNRQIEHRILYADGTIGYMAVRFAVVKDAQGRTIKTYGVNQDITEQKQAEQERIRLQEQLQQAQKLESIGRLAGGIAHDFNNILSVILGYGTTILSQLPVDNPLRADVEEIVAAGERAAALTRQLLAFSRKQTFQPAILDLNVLIRNLEKMLRRLIGENIALELSLDESLAAVLADPSHLEQVIVNLAVNACDAMPEGGRLLIETANSRLDESYAAAHPEVNPGDYVLLAVTDTGHGMTPEVKEHVFEPFFTTKEKGTGTGLGLSTIYGIVKQSGGHISVYSEVGKGTSFRIYLPQAEGKREPATLETPATRLSGKGEHVLIVEDDESLRRLISASLSKLGYQVTAAADGTEALQLVEEKGLEPDLVLTDVIMPKMNGKDLVEQLRRTRPQQKALYMSGYTESAIAFDASLPPGTLFIDKPFSLDKLAAKVREAMEKA